MSKTACARARPLLFDVAHRCDRLLTPRWGRQMRLEPLDDDHTGRQRTFYQWGRRGNQRTLDLHYTISPAVCTEGSGDTRRMASSAVLGLFDHFSTYAISEADRSYRPGVSVVLDMTLASGHEALLRPESRLLMSCAVPKVGKQVAFANAEVSVDGMPLAWCNHIKYMPLRGLAGTLWQALFSPAGRALLKTGILTPLLKYVPGGGTSEDPDLVADLSELVALESVNSASNGVWSARSCPINSRQTNPLGDLHGGCQAMLVEKLASQVAATTESRVQGAQPSLRSIRMAYYRPGPGETTGLSLKAQAGQLGIECEVRSKDGGPVLTEGSLIFA